MNAQLSKDGKSLVITIPFDETGKPSTSGKSVLHATTGGNKPTEILVGGKALVVAVNAYTSAK